MVDNNKKSYWSEPLMAFARMSSWIAGPVILGLIVGKALDVRYGTTPIFFVISVSLSFFCSIYGIVKEAKRYMRSIEKEADIQKKNGANNNDDR